MVVESDALNNFRRPCVAEDFDAGGHSRSKSGKGSFNPNATACDVRHRLVAYRLANQPTVAGPRAALLDGRQHRLAGDRPPPPVVVSKTTSSPPSPATEIPFQF
jgi:hypothetical protein